LHRLFEMKSEGHVYHARLLKPAEGKYLEEVPTAPEQYL